MDDGDDDKELEEIEVLAELAEIMGPGTEASTTGAKSGMQRNMSTRLCQRQRFDIQAKKKYLCVGKAY